MIILGIAAIVVALVLLYGVLLELSDASAYLHEQTGMMRERLEREEFRQDDRTF